MSSFDRLAQRALETDTLMSVLLELTYRCNLDCFFCYNDLAKKGVPVPMERYLSLLEELRDLGVLNLTLSGGEPLSHPAFWQIGRRASELAFAVRIKTNGHSVDGEVARRLHDEIRPFIVEVSLHGATQETHDRQTRVPGSFERLMTNLPAMTRAGLRVKLSGTMTAWNADEIEEMFSLADGLGLSLRLSATVSPRDDGDREPLSIAPSVDQIAALFRILQERAGMASEPVDPEACESEAAAPASPKARKNCGVASTGLVIDPYGDVLPCVQWRQPVGNIRHQTLREIWLGSSLLPTFRSHSIEAARVVDSLGDAGRAMAFCPAIAEMLTGSPVKIYDLARDRMRAFGAAYSDPGRIESVPPRPLTETATTATSMG